MSIEQPGSVYPPLSWSDLKQRIRKELEEEGVLESSKRGNQKYYFLNKKYPLLKEVKKIFELKYGLREQCPQYTRHQP